MRIVFKKIPKLAIYFYFVGIICLSLALLVYFYQPHLMALVHIQQFFIGGAILVATGSVINTVHQFKNKDLDK